jgi:hypothetical protein
MLEYSRQWISVTMYFPTAYCGGKTYVKLNEFLIGAGIPADSIGWGKGVDITNVIVSFSDESDRKDLNPRSIDTLKYIAARAGVLSVRISSTMRTPEEQAQAMFNNIVSFGEDNQRAFIKVLAIV